MAFDIENFPTSEMAKKSLDMVTQGFYDRSYVAKWLYQVMGMEMDEIQAFIDTMREQSFPETATWGLKYHEIKWGLPVRENLSYEERRRIIIAKRDYVAPMTPYKMESFLRDVIGMEVVIADIHDPTRYNFVPDHPNKFKVYFIGDPTLDVKKAIAQIRKLKQSHTTFEINDRREIVIDESKIESFKASNMLLRIKIGYWDIRTFDGSWFFDGEYLMNAQRRYGMRIGIKRRIAIMEEKESLTASGIIFLAIVGEEENYRYGLGYGLSVLESLNLEDKAKVVLSMKQEEHEAFDNLRLAKHSRDYWLWDGTKIMDGSKHFDSIYREEELV